MARALPIGVQDFKEIRDSDLLYVDKTDMVSQILSEGAKVYLYTRPRRFGKSLNLSMLDAFFNLKYPKDNGWFDGLKVSECGEWQEHRNAYPVIYFDFKDMDARDFDMFIERLSYKTYCINILITRPSAAGDVSSDPLSLIRSARVGRCFYVGIRQDGCNGRCVNMVQRDIVSDTTRTSFPLKAMP